jgi:hypothetical protein
LRRDVELRAARDVPAVFFGDQRGESVSHKPMLADVDSGRKVLNDSVFRNQVTRGHGGRDE